MEWAEGHVFGNVDELDLSNRMVVHMLQYVKMPIVVVFVEAGDDRDTYERSVVLPVATEYAGRMKFYTALPSRTAPKLKQYGLTAGDCPTVVIDDGVGGLGLGGRAPGWKGSASNIFSRSHTTLDLASCDASLRRATCTGSQPRRDGENMSAPGQA